MIISKRITAAVIASATVLSAAASCSKKNKGTSEPVSSEKISETAGTTSAPAPAKGSMDIVWLSDFDLNPEGGQRSAALALFEDVYGGSIKYITVPADQKLTKLETMVLAGEEVDMFPYDASVMPEGVAKGLFEPLDPYFDDMGVSEGLWSDMSEIMDMFAYKGEHYVVPYDVSDLQLVTYSRKLVQSEGMDDPYTLYKDNKWDWNAFNAMINKFSESESTLHHFGISGYYGKAALASSGKTVISFDGSSFTNNVSARELGNSEALMQDLQSRWLYNKNWFNNFPTDMNTLFYTSGDWSLPYSNKENPEADIMIVPFPRHPELDKNYIACDYNARMLVKNSAKGAAVAAYLKCERTAVSESKYTDKAKEAALKTMTEEQYNALQDYKAAVKEHPIFDFGYGMGSRMNGNGGYTFETRGVMDNIEYALLEGGAPVGSWDELRDRMSPIIDEELQRYK